MNTIKTIFTLIFVSTLFIHTSVHAQKQRLEPIKVKYEIKKAMKTLTKDEASIQPPIAEWWTAIPSDSMSIDSSYGKAITDKINEIIYHVHTYYNGMPASTSEKLFPIKKVNNISAMITREKSPCVAFYGEAVLPVLGKDSVVEILFGIVDGSSIYFSFNEFNPVYFWGSSSVTFYPTNPKKDIWVRASENDVYTTVKLPFAYKYNYYSSLVLAREILADASEIKQNVIALK